MRKRFARFNLALADDKTRLLEFGPFAINNRQRRGAGKPETFNFLGFAHLREEDKQRNVRASGGDPPSLSSATHGSCLRQEPNAETRSSLPWRGLWATMIR